MTPADLLDGAVRRLRTDDAVVVGHLEMLCRTDASSYRGATELLDEVPAVGEWDSLVGDEQRPVWVATIDDTPVGYLAASVDGGVMSVRQVYVHADARDLGLGDALLAAALAAAREAGCRRLEGSALPGDRLTKNLFERAGITARKIIVSTQLG